MSTQKENFQDNTFSLLKGLHHTKIAMEYYEDVSKLYHGSAKHLMLGYANKCKWVIDNIRHRLPEDVLKEIDGEIRDSLFMDAIEDKLIHFNEDQREMIETVIDLIASGEKIEISY